MRERELLRKQIYSMHQNKSSVIPKSLHEKGTSDQPTIEKNNTTKESTISELLLKYFLGDTYHEMVDSSLFDNMLMDYANSFDEEVNRYIYIFF
jgi:hypothetical protein